MAGYKIIKRNAAGEIVAIYPNAVVAGREEGVSDVTIRCWCSGHRMRKSGRYTFEYDEKTQYVTLSRSDTICWRCENACGGCSWSREFKPVPGWTAERRDMKMHTSGDGMKQVESYVVQKCPEFMPDKPRPREFSWMEERCVECNSVRMCAAFGPICKKGKKG